jgi:SAM-dependent methyltransferase
MDWHNEALYDNPFTAELYDTLETQTDDVQLIRRLIQSDRRLKILEPFCGTGRILLPLAGDGHHMTGFDLSAAMTSRAVEKASAMGEDAHSRISIFQADVIHTEWPQGFDLVILGGNCLYELATPQEQEQVIVSANASLKSGGYVFLDNDHMEGELPSSWLAAGVRQSFPCGTTSDGIRVESTIETIWYDAQARLVRFRRRTTAEALSGSTRMWEYIQQKHPVSIAEMAGWLEGHGFVIEHHFGDREGQQYHPESPRSIFWARKA